jgi:GNAT acetyltransferase-like protein
MGRIRTFTESDIPQVARVHRLVFQTADRDDEGSSAAYDAYFRDVFLGNPWQDAGPRSLVYQEDNGRLTGFLGVVPRAMTMNGRRLRAAISSQVVVDPATHVSAVAVHLAKAFLEGPQDLSIADEADDLARKIWEELGGRTSLLHSLHWIRPLRPARLMLSMMRGRQRLVPLAVAAAPLAPIIDALVTRIPHGQFYQASPEHSSADHLSPEALASRLPELARQGSLRVVYDDETFRWLIDRARQRRADGLHAAVIRKRDKVFGWYLYCLDPDRIASVLQIGADARAMPQVLDQLFYQAARHGALAVTGRLEPRFLQSLSDKLAFFHHRGPWVLLDSKRPELLQSFESGDACFSRLDGDWSLAF